MGETVVTFTIFDYLARRNIRTFSIVLFLGRQMYFEPYLYDVFVIHVSLPVVLDSDTEYHRRGVEIYAGSTAPLNGYCNVEVGLGSNSTR